MTVATPPRAAEDVPKRPTKAPTKRRFGRNRTTPGVLGVLLIAVTVVSLAVGAVCAYFVQARDQTLQSLATTDGELHAAAEKFYRALSTADVAANSAFLARDQKLTLERVGFETSYEGAVGEAQSALATLVAAAGDSTDAAQRTLLGTLPGRLSEFTELVQAARGYNRLEEPVASTYQLLAGNSMREQLLPAARSLYESFDDTLRSDQRESTGIPWLELALGGLVVLMLIGVQIYLWRRTKRVFNLGLMLATVAAAAMVAWIGVSAFTAGREVERSQQDIAVIDAVAEARVVGQLARGSESLAPVAARDGLKFDTYEQAFQREAGRLVGADGKLAAARAVAEDATARESIDAAIDSAKTWTDFHDQVQEALAENAQRKAVQRLVTSEATEAFGAFDDALGAAVDDTRLRFDTNASAAGTASTGVLIGVIGLALLTAVAAAFGVWQRLREYR